jgi:branched-subunit amino acid ABC-type transport system permease component
MELLVTAAVAGIFSGLIYAMVGVGHSMLFRSTGLLNLAHGELVVVGALVGFTMTQVHGVPLVLGGIGAAVVAGSLSVLIKIGIVDRMPRGTALQIAVCTFGVALLMNAAMRALWGTDIYSLPSFPGPPDTFHVGYDRAVLPGQAIWVLAAAVVVFGGVYLLEQKTDFGRMLRAVGVDAPVARTFGIPARRVAILAFALVGATAGIAGFVMSPVLFMTVSGAVTLGLKGLVAAILGGFDRRSGALVGGLVLGLAEQTVVAYLGAGWQDTVVFVLLLLILLVRPAGILPGRVAAAR